MTEADAEQAVAEALVAVLGAHAAIVALTGRASGNLAPVDDDRTPGALALAYDVGPTTPRDTVGEHYDVAVTLLAEAPTRAGVRALLAAAKVALTPAAFRAADADALLEAVTTTQVVRGESEDDDDPDRPPETFAGAFEGTIWYTPPA